MDYSLSIKDDKMNMKDGTSYPLKIRNRSKIKSQFTYANITVIYRNKDTSNLVKEGENTVTDLNISDPKYLQQMLAIGEFKIQQAQPDGTFDDYEGTQLFSSEV